MPPENREEDNQSARVDYLLKRAGQVPQPDFARLTDEAVEHAAQESREDPGPEPEEDEARVPRSWRPLGPRNLGGRIRCLAQDERNPQIVYAGSAHGGLWKTTDAGETWQVLDYLTNINAHHGVPIGAVALSYSNPQILYIGTGEPPLFSSGRRKGTPENIPGNGLYWSRDGGQTFTQIDDPDSGTIAAAHYETIVVDPWEPERFWAATPDKGLARGTPSLTGAPRLHRDTVDHTSASSANQKASDIWVDFGADRTTPPTTVTVFAALWGTGVYRAVYNRINDRWQGASGAVWQQITPPFPAGFMRIKLALCRKQPNWLAAVAAVPDIADLDGDNKTSDAAAGNVFLSEDSGENWKDTGSRVAKGDTGVQANYDLVIGLHPDDPSIIITGSVDLFLGRYKKASRLPNWSKIMDWKKHDKGDRAQHADQHALLFDVADSRRIWVGNDGGLSSSTDLGATWRERGLGINAAQFYDITTHPKFPYIYAGGLQDNGTWLSYGGQSWHHINGGDGGAVAFEPTSPRRMITTWQEGLDLTDIRSNGVAIGTSDYMNRMPDIPLDSNSKVINQIADLTPLGVSKSHASTFVGEVTWYRGNNLGDTDHILVARRGAAYLSTNRRNFTQLKTGSFAGASRSPVNQDPVSKIVYSPQNPDTHWWVATEWGELFFTNDGNATTWTNISLPTDVGTGYITSVAINPNNDAVIAISVTLDVSTSATSQGRVFLSGDAGTTWSEISGRTAPWSSGARNQLNPSAATALVFDPGSPADLAEKQTLYCGTLAGVYVIRNAVAPSGSVNRFNPKWRTFNKGLPLTLVFDLETVTFEDADNNTKHLLRCATHARGAYECELSAATPAVKLLVRSKVIDDGRQYHTKHHLPDDPRLGPGTTMNLNKAFDIRVDTPPFRYFGSAMDGLEFDEHLRSQALAAGVENIVYVQIHNVGSGVSNNTQLNVYWAITTKPLFQAPDLQSDFWEQFPEVPDGGDWQRLGSKNIPSLSTGHPLVIGFRWNVPGHLTGEIALLAILTDPVSDALVGTSLGNIVDPGKAGSFIGKERRAALRQTKVLPAPANALLRDGFDDTGSLGETAWGARSHDIIVVDSVEPDPATAFADRNDLRKADRLKGSATNHIYIRVNNSGADVLNNVSVQLFSLPMATLEDPSTWTHLNKTTPTTMANIPSHTSVIMPVINWASPPDPEPAKWYLLLALVQSDEDQQPDYLTRVNSISSLWEMVLESVDSGNTVLRGIRWEA